MVKHLFFKINVLIKTIINKRINNTPPSLRCAIGNNMYATQPKPIACFLPAELQKNHDLGNPADMKPAKCAYI